MGAVCKVCASPEKAEVLVRPEENQIDSIKKTTSTRSVAPTEVPEVVVVTPAPPPGKRPPEPSTTQTVSTKKKTETLSEPATAPNVVTTTPSVVDSPPSKSTSETHREVISPPTPPTVSETPAKEIETPASPPPQQEPPPKIQLTSPSPPPPTPPPRAQQAPTKRHSGGTPFGGTGTVKQVAMPAPRAPATDTPPEPVVDTRSPRGAGAYMTFDWTHQGCGSLEWRKTQVETGFLYASPKPNDVLAQHDLKPVPEHKYKGKKEPISRNSQGDPKSLYRGVCSFVKAGRTHGCDIEMLPNGRSMNHCPKDLSIFIHKPDDKVTQITWGGEFDSLEIDAVAVGPSKARDLKKDMTLNDFLGWGSKEGEVLKL